MEEQIKKADEKIEYAKNNFGDVEIREAILEKANIYSSAMMYKEAIEIFNKALEISAGVGKKMDVIFELLKIGLTLKDLDSMQANINKFKELFKEGGDWERKNKLKVYEGIYDMLIRDFKKASDELINVIPNFTTMDIIDFKGLVFYSVITGLVSQPR